MKMFLKEMKKFHAAPALLVLLAAMLCLAGCGSDSAGSADADHGDVVARVNDTEITQDQLDSYSKINMQLMGYDPSTITDEETEQMIEQLVIVGIVTEYYEGQDEDIYGDEYEENAQSFITSAHDSVEDFLTQYEISDEQLTEFYRGQYAVSKLFEEVQAEKSEDDISQLASEYYEENKESFKNDDGTYGTLEDEDVQQSVYYSVYSDMYDDRINEIREDMDIEIY